MTTDGAISRRALLGAGAGALVLGRAATPELAVAQAGSASPPTQPLGDPILDEQMLFAFGAAAAGTAEYGEVATVLERVRARGATIDAMAGEFAAMARTLEEAAVRSRAGGHDVSARDRFLRSARYLAVPLYYALGTSEPTAAAQAAAYRRMRARWNAAARLFRPPIEPVRIPYGSSSLPGWLLRPPGRRRRRPTVVLVNGNDGQMIDIYGYGGAAAVARGWNALIVEGPGQGSMLFLRRVRMRPDFEAVLQPVVDWLRARDDVDRRRLAAIGWSQGGALLARGLAHEHRLAAAVLDPGSVAEIAAFHLPDELMASVRRGEAQAANEAWAAVLPALTPSIRFAFAKGALPFRQPDFYRLVRYVLRFSLDPRTLSRVRTPTLVTEYADEQVYPGQARQVYDALRGPKRLHRFTADEGAQLHDAPMAPRWRDEVVFDWLEDRLSAAARGSSG